MPSEDPDVRHHEGNCETWLFGRGLTVMFVSPSPGTQPQQVATTFTRRRRPRPPRSRPGGTVGEDPHRPISHCLGRGLTGEVVGCKAFCTGGGLAGHAQQSGNEALACDGAKSHFLAASSLAARSTFVSLRRGRETQGSRAQKLGTCHTQKKARGTARCKDRAWQRHGQNMGRDQREPDQGGRETP